MAYDKIIIPREGKAITVKDDLSLYVPNDPIIPFIEGDGIGAEVTPTMRKVVDSAVHKAYASEKKIYWMEIYCGEKAVKIYDGNDCPEETLQALKEFLVCIKGPLKKPVDGISVDGMDIEGIRIKRVIKSIEAVSEERVATKNSTSDDMGAYNATVYQATTDNVESSYDNASIDFPALRYAGPDKVNPLPLILSAEMMLRDMGWIRAADLIAKGVTGAIAKQDITNKIEPDLPDEITVLNCSDFGDLIITEMKVSEKK